MGGTRTPSKGAQCVREHTQMRILRKCSAKKGRGAGSWDRGGDQMQRWGKWKGDMRVDQPCAGKPWMYQRWCWLQLGLRSRWTRCQGLRWNTLLFDNDRGNE